MEQSSRRQLVQSERAPLKSPDLSQPLKPTTPLGGLYSASAMAALAEDNQGQHISASRRAGRNQEMRRFQRPSKPVSLCKLLEISIAGCFARREGVELNMVNSRIALHITRQNYHEDELHGQLPLGKGM